MYSLGSPEALTQFLYQRLRLPLFGDVREQLPERTHTKETEVEQSSGFVFQFFFFFFRHHFLNTR